MRRLAVGFIAVLLALSLAPAAHASGKINGRIAIDTGGTIQITQVDGTDLITTSDGGFSKPQWTDSGRLIVGSDDGISILKAKDGAAVVPLPAANANDTLPSLSRDGKRALYSTSGGIVIQKITSSTRTTLVPTGSFSNAIARFSKDSKFVYFAATGGQIMRVSIHGGTPVQITSASDGCPCRQPDISPDGKLMVFKRGASDIVVKPVSPPQNTSITPISTSGDAPVFSPDGGHIAYIGTGNAITIRSAEGDGAPITTGIITSSVFDWGP